MKTYRTLMITCLLLLASQFSFSQTYSSIVSDKEIYDFLNWQTKLITESEKKLYGKNRTVIVDILPWDSANFINMYKDIFPDREYYDLDDKYIFKTNKKLNEFFTQENKDYLFKQFTSITNAVWQKKFDSGKLVNKDNIYTPFYYYYSIPLFSKDRKYVIFQMHYYCGEQCGRGGYYIYRSAGNKQWMLVTEINTWVL
ncbi:MAG: hypothetical protein LBV43_13455 [Prevotella sp.]|jgi:hypothetical protein|nr:hypothetical protein [Prevotella sp.]